MTTMNRIAEFCDAYSLDVPILMAPMAGACPVELAAAVARGGGMGACGALLMKPQAIAQWARELRSITNGSFQMNLWIPDPAPRGAVRSFTGGGANGHFFHYGALSDSVC